MSVYGYGLEPYGYGPYGGLGGVSVPTIIPPLGGYGGYSYGYSSYGSLGGFGKPSIAITGGYGGCAYGTSAYGCIGGLSAPPEVISAISVTGFIIEVFFSQEMSPDADLFDPASYTLVDVTGAAPATVISVQGGVEGVWGFTSVLLNHTGTTLGGLYTVIVSGPRDIGGTEIAAYAPLNQADVLCKGEPPPFTITPISGTELLYEFEQDMLPESGFTPGIEDPTAYGFETDYPQNIIPQAATHPYNLDPKQVKLDVLGMTSAQYTGVVSPATAIEYDATFLPTDPQANFIAQEIGSGSTTLGTNEILLTKQIGFSYGWRFIDTSNKLLPNSSYRVDVSFDVSSAVKIDPTIDSNPLILLLISDGSIQVDLSFKRVAGVDTIEIESGVFNASSSINWSEQAVTVSLARNQKADTYTVVVNGEPIVAGLTPNFTGPPGFPAGIQFHVDPAGAYEVIDLPLQNILFTATQTVFSAAWNFLHNQTAPFVGSAANAKDFLLTKKGPLVKGWGDATPATKQDVTVYVNGTPVEVLDVNPYYGKIFLTTPIPLMPPGLMEVNVDYIWFPSPIMDMAGLNTLGVVLNKFDCKPLCGPGVYSKEAGLPGGGTNGIEFSRFPMGLVLGPGGPKTRKPLLRSPRFIAFQQQYTASLNSPTTLLLNRNPHQIALEGEQKEVEGDLVFYEGTTPPTEDTPSWDLVGTEEIIDFNSIPFNGGVGLVDGTAFLPSNVLSTPDAENAGIYQVYKVTAGSFGEGDVTFYTREIDTSFDSSIIIVSRFQIMPSEDINDEDPDTNALPQPDGVFVGVGFGCHTNHHLYLVGALLINGVQHVGMLVDPAFPEQAGSWEIAYQTPIKVIDATTVSIATEDLPQLIRERLLSDEVVRFQILEGTQKGVYTVLEIIDQSDGTSTISIDGTNPFPADPSLFGNRDFTAIFETKWDGDGEENNPITYRLVIKNDRKTIPEGFAELFVGSSFGGTSLTLQGAPPFAIPPDGVLLYPTGNKGEVFWGSLDRKAKNLSNWHFVRYAVDPGATSVNFRQIVVAAEMNSLPENDPNNVWFLTQEFGSRQIDITADHLLLKATSSNLDEGAAGLDLSIGYGRIEPFLTRRMAIDVDTTFHIDSGTLGYGDLVYSVKDGRREVRLATLLYEETSQRQLLNLESRSLSGLLLPEKQGWNRVGGLTLEDVQGQRVLYEQVSGETLLYSTSLLDPGATALKSDSRIFEMRMKVNTIGTTNPNGDTGIFIGTDAGPSGNVRGVGLQLRVGNGGSDQIFLFSLETGLEVAAFDFVWNDGVLHTYRVLVDADSDTVTVVGDDIVLGTADLNLFALSSTETEISFGFASPDTDTTVELEDLSVIVSPPSTAKRTLGVWLGGDKTDINNWRIPRTDTLSVPNSDLSAVVEEMDWTQRTKVRIHRDPGWGVTILRPDLPPPPGFTGNFATQFTEPSAGWINVEYRDLPKVSDTEVFGAVSFGALEAESISQMRIDEVRYRIYHYASENIIMPNHMVLNQYNVITSGEFTKDVTVEEVVVTSTDSTTIELSVSNIVADRIFSLTFVNAAGETVQYFPGSFTFDKDTQVIKITSYMTLGYYPSLDVPDVEDPFVDNPSLNEVQNFPYPIEVLLDPNDPNFAGDFDENAYPIDVRVPVTVSFAPGKPLTKTYLCSQPLLDGTTLLNEGTPAFETSQIGKAISEVAWGSRINDPNDVLNTDPDFILNDPFRFLDFKQDAKIQYEDVDFCEVSEGDTCRLSPFCDDNIPGASEAGTEGTTPGDIGNGLINIDFEGLAFTETDPITFSDGPDDGFGGFTGTQFLEASGGDENAGGNLQEAILFTPLTPQTIPFKNPDGSVGWSVFGQLYDTLTQTTTTLFFGTEKAGS